MAVAPLELRARTRAMGKRVMPPSRLPVEEQSSDGGQTGDSTPTSADARPTCPKKQAGSRKKRQNRKKRRQKKPGAGGSQGGGHSGEPPTSCTVTPKMEAWPKPFLGRRTDIDSTTRRESQQPRDSWGDAGDTAPPEERPANRLPSSSSSTEPSWLSVKFDEVTDEEWKALASFVRSELARKPSKETLCVGQV